MFDYRLWKDDSEKTVLGCTMLTKGDNDYITILHQDKICVYRNCTLFLEYPTKDMNVNGAVYHPIEDILYFTKKDDNSIYKYKSENNMETIQLKEFKNIKIRKCIEGTNGWLILETDNGKCMMAYDLPERKVLFLLPIQNNFLDFAFRMNDSCTAESFGVMLGRDEIDVSRYEDDEDTIDIIMQSFNWDEQQNCIELCDKFSIGTSYDNWNDRYISITSSEKSMKLPLFKYYLYSYPKEKSLSAYGNYVVYYNKDFNGISISRFENGDVHRLFVLPKECEKYYGYYYNETTDVLTVVSNEWMKRYSIENDETVIEELNTLYNDIHKKRISAKSVPEFEPTFFRAIASGKCNELCIAQFNRQATVNIIPPKKLTSHQN